MNKDELKYNVISRLSAGDEPRAIAADLDVSLASVYTTKRELAKAKENGDLAQFLDMSKVMTSKVLDLAGRGVPEVLEAEAAETLRELSNRKNNADKLNDELTVTASTLLTQVTMRIGANESVAELSMLSDIVCDLQNAFFNKKQTQVNIQNNTTSADGGGYSEYLSDVPNH